MPEPKKRMTKRRTNNRRSHHRLKLARRVNKTSPVKVHTTNKQSTKPNKADSAEKPFAKKKAPAKKPAATKKKTTKKSDSK